VIFYSTTDIGKNILHMTPSLEGDNFENRNIFIGYNQFFPGLFHFLEILLHPGLKASLGYCNHCHTSSIKNIFKDIIYQVKRKNKSKSIFAIKKSPQKTRKTRKKDGVVEWWSSGVMGKRVKNLLRVARCELRVAGEMA
jgi:hypothetical protein